MNLTLSPRGKKTLVTAGIGVALLSTAATFIGHTEGGWASRPRAWHAEAQEGMGPAQLCTHRYDRHLDDLTAFAGAFFRFTTEQTEAWNRLTDALRAGRASIATACQELTGEGGASSASDHLAQVETMLAAGLEVVRQVRPAFNQFYAVLTDEQKKALDELISRRRHH